MKRIGIGFILAAGLVGACGDDTPVDPSGSTTGTGAAGGASSSSVSSTGGGNTGAPLTETFTVEGTVVDEDGNAVEGAFVLQGGRGEDLVLSAADGSFSYEMRYDGRGTPAIVATKEGYRSRGLEFLSLPEEPVVLDLIAVKPPDNAGAYVYGDPGQGDDPTTAYCGHCHIQITKDFRLSAHADAARDPQVQDLFAGVASSIASAAGCAQAGGVWRSGLEPGTSNTIDKCYLGDGVLPDLNGCGGPTEQACDDPALASPPTAFGACADCHAPGMNGEVGGRSLHEATDIAYDAGVHCDFCHKVNDVDLMAPPGVGGRMKLQRPQELNFMAQPRAVMFGPLLDVPTPAMGGSYAPVFDEATFCAGCHQQEQPALISGQSLDAQRWPNGLPVHTTYEEWMASAYGQSNTPCQHCHMPGNFELQSSSDLATYDTASITFGFVRSPDDNRRHLFRGPLMGRNPYGGETAPLIDEAAFISVQVSATASTVDASVSVANVGCGHALPTGEPMRRLILLVEAEGQGCGSLAPIAGSTVDDLGGRLAEGTVGTDVTVAGATVTWPGTTAKAGDVLRLVRPNGFETYGGIGFFANPALTPAEKGRPLREPLAEATVLSVVGDVITVDASLTASAGDLVYLAEARPSMLDEQPSTALAGLAGTTFGRVLVDANGRRQVPHHRAIDMASDNRIAPGTAEVSTYGFDRLAGCTNATVRATLIYRAYPLDEARRRGWDGRDHIIATAAQTIPLP